MSNYYIQGSGGWPFGLDVLSPSGQLFPSRTDPNLLIGYFGFPTNPVEQGYFFRFWEGLDTSANIWYGDSNFDGIADLRANFWIQFGVSPNSQVTAKITFNKNTKAYTRAGTPSAESVNFVSNNSSIIGSTPSSQNNASINVYHNGWIWEKDFTFNTTSTVNYKIVLGGGSFYGDNNLDGLATLNENFISLNVVAGNTYRFRAKPFTADLSISPLSFEYEVVCLTCPNLKQNQIISTPFNVYNKLTTDPPFSLQASTNSNLPLSYSSSSPLFTINNQGLVTLLGLTGFGNVLISQGGNNQWNPASKEVFINIEDVSGSCINQCLNTGSLYYTKDTFINLYNETGSGMFISNKKIDISRLPLLTSNESWLDYGQEFSGYGLSGFNNQEAGIILKLNDSTRLAAQNIFHLNYGTNESKDIVGNYHKQLISIRPQKPINSGYLSYFANDRAWATYDVSTGMVTGSLTRNNVFSYGVDIVASGVLSGNNFYYTGNIDINTKTGRAYVSNLEKNPVLYTESFNALTILSFNGIQDFCEKVQECEDPKEPEPLEICYTGELTNSAAFQSFLSGVESTANATIINRPEENDLLTNIGTGSEIKHANTIYSGYILYNNWQSGDYIKWNLYNFNFVDLYQEYHLGNFPPYRNTGFTLYYPNDFNSLDSLVNKLNQNIDVLKTYPVWYPYECLKDTESGIFLTGALMRFYKNTGTTGDLPISHFNNRIDFLSYRSFPQLSQTDEYLSYGISIFSPIEPKTQFFKGWSYLIPTTIQLEGLNRDTQNWEILDINGKRPETNSLSVSLLSNGSNSSSTDSLLAGEIGSLLSGESVVESMGNLPLEGVVEEEEEESLPEEELEDKSPPNCKDVIYTNVQRNINFNKNPLCPPTLSLRDVIVTAPKEECKLEKTVDKDGNVVQKYSNAQLCADGEGGGTGGDIAAGGGPPPGGDEGESIGDWYIYPTGWNINTPEGGGVGGLSFDFKIQNLNNNIIYDKYKVSLSNFISTPNPNLVQKDSFFIRRIKLYTLDKANFDIHKGPELCTIGADYIIDVSGLMPVEISGIWNYDILPEESGIYRFFKTPFERPIAENERSVIFNKVSGKIISENATGFLSTSGFGVGNVSYTDSSRYFYNPLTQSVYFTENLTGIVTGFGVLSGEKIAIKQSVINQELLFGGRLANSSLQYHEIVSNGTLDSTIEDVEYVKYDVLGFYPISGIVTGNTVNGKLEINNQIILTGSGVNNIYAYYPEATGFTFAETLFNINYNNLNNFDFLSINDNTIIYHSDSSQYPAPSYFNSNNTLISIINESSNVFLCTGEIINSNIQLKSTLKGASGNINLTSNSTGIQIINYISGINIYPRLYKIVTERTFTPILEEFPELGGNYSFNRVVKDPIMTGNISDALLATGFYYSNQGSGNVTGNVLTFTGVRTFFDVWDVATGNLRRDYLSFLQNNFISGDSYYKNTNFGTVPTNVKLRAFYLNYLGTSTQEESDVADLIIKDLNNPSLSETGVIFRLNGLK